MKKKITPELLQQLFDRTHYKLNGLDLNIVFNDGFQHSTENHYSVDVFSLVYYLLSEMGNMDIGFNSVLVYADGGIKEYLITYRWRGYIIIVSEERHDVGRPDRFESVDNFCEWLNGHAARINQKVDP